jgi:hypothetical protein
MVALRSHIREDRKARVIVDATLGVAEVCNPAIASAVIAYKTTSACWRAIQAYESEFRSSGERKKALSVAEMVLVKELGTEIAGELLGSAAGLSVLGGLDEEASVVAEEFAGSIAEEALGGMERGSKGLKAADESMKAAYRRLAEVMLAHTIRHDPEARARLGRLSASKRREIEGEIGRRAEAIASTMWRRSVVHGAHRVAGSAEGVKRVFREALKEHAPPLEPPRTENAPTKPARKKPPKATGAPRGKPAGSRSRGRPRRRARAPRRGTTSRDRRAAGDRGAPKRRK